MCSSDLTHITPREFAVVASKGTVPLIDVRTPAEFGVARVPGAVNMPLDRLDPQSLRARVGDGPLYVICQTGTRSQLAVDRMLAEASTTRTKGLGARGGSSRARTMRAAPRRRRRSLRSSRGRKRLARPLFQSHTPAQGLALGARLR